MYLITRISSAPLQNMNLILPDSTVVHLTLYFMPQQFGWFFTNITYNTFTLNSLRVCNSPNMLLQFQNQIPFGIACYSSNNREPTQQEDFLSGASRLYLLGRTDMVQVYSFLQSSAGFN